MVKSLNFETMSLVVETWEMARRVSGFEEKAGMAILTRLFELEPRSKTVFGFSRDAKLSECPRLQIGALIHAKRMLFMLETVINLLGPDTEMLTEILESLGKRHIRFGVKASYVPYLGVAVNQALKELLGEKIWTTEVENAWAGLFEELGAVIMKGILMGVDNRKSILDDAPSFVGIL